MRFLGMLANIGGNKLCRILRHVYEYDFATNVVPRPDFLENSVCAGLARFRLDFFA
jgi:hypothetical protein